MNSQTLKKLPCLEHVLGLMVTRDLKLYAYIRAFVNDAGIIVGFFYHSRKYLISSAFLYT